MLCCSQGVIAATDHDQLSNVPELNLEELVKIQVTSVSKKIQALSDAPAAVYVISHDDIKRSGVTSVPEALRMAPGLDVARIDANKWAVTARGFNGNFANKLLVMIDGRSIYTPAFSGVYWDAQDVLLEDVDRIEVIRGPGATLWGANAVNGVINIITKRAEDTQGGHLTAGGGNKETGFGSLRYGVKLGKHTFARAYVNGFQRNAMSSPQGFDAGDDWQKTQGGFRVDSQLSDKSDITVEGDVYTGENHQTLRTPSLTIPYFHTVHDLVSSSGGNLLSRFRHTMSATEEVNLQVYFDHYKREEFFISEARNTFDFDLQHSFSPIKHNNAIWGMGYRLSHDDFTNSSVLSLNPTSRNTQLFSAFVQDEITLIEDSLWLTIGSKFEHNDYTGFEGQPNVKLMWAPHPEHRIWASIARSVRTPSRAENDFLLHHTVLPPNPNFPYPASETPIGIDIVGNRSFKAEVQYAYELGYRFTFANKASLDLTAFFNDYQSLRNNALAPQQIGGNLQNLTITQPLNLTNTSIVNTYGFEAAIAWQMLDWWRWDNSYSFLKTDTQANNLIPTIAISPNHKLSLRAALNPTEHVNLDFWLRYSSSAKAINPQAFALSTIPEYVTMDVRLGWQIHPHIELSITGQNLLDNQHLEYIEETYVLPVEISRGVYGKINWQF
ncbi:MAG: TonB-dependent receptor [Methylococcales bacterium]